jgi:hypothetical protein
MEMPKRLLVGFFAEQVGACSAVCAGSELNMKNGPWKTASQVKRQAVTIPLMDLIG